MVEINTVKHLRVNKNTST